MRYVSRAEIITVGKEILVGRTLDTNSNWIAKRVTSLGGRVSRITCVDDDSDDIAEAVRNSRERECRVVIITGGLGPTADDITLAAVAEAFGIPLELDNKALGFVRERYRHFFEEGFVDSPEMTRSREKMAKIPKGSTWLSNDVGAAPGVLLETEDISVCSLPGVPEEMKSMFENHVVPFLKKVLPDMARVEKRVVTQVKDESELADIIESIMGEMTGIYLKSSPTHFGEDVEIEVFVTASADDEKSARNLVEVAIERLAGSVKVKNVS